MNTVLRRQFRQRPVSRQGRHRYLRLEFRTVLLALRSHLSRPFQPVSLSLADCPKKRDRRNELESKLSEADQLDQTLATALQQADALRQSILKKAFSGQLVAQDKNDEPATALLERIRAGKSNGMSTPRNRRKSG